MTQPSGRLPLSWDSTEDRIKGIEPLNTQKSSANHALTGYSVLGNRKDTSVLENFKIFTENPEK